MSDASAAQAPARKRVRINPNPTRMTPTSTTTLTGRATQPPKQIAVAFVKHTCATLQPKIAEILVRLGNTHIVHMMKVFNKTHQIELMKKDTTFIPRSAKLAFKLLGSKEAEASPEFQQLEAETNELIDQM